MIAAALHFIVENAPRLVPNAAQAGQAVALLAVCAGMTAIGAVARLAGRDTRVLPEADLLVGWAAVAALFVVIGSFTALPLTVAGIIAALAMVAALAVLLHRRQPLLPAGGGRMLVMLAPLLLVTLSMVASENDDFGQWLPNLRYILLVDHFPGPGWPDSDSLLPAYPYAASIVAYLTSRLTGSFAETAVDRFNLLLLGSLALLLVRLFRNRNDDAPVGWGAVAAGLSAVTLASPTFVAKLVLSNYVDCATAVALAFSAVLALRAVENDEQPGLPFHMQLAGAFGGLILAKQANLVLLALALAGIAIIARRTPRRLLRFAPALAVAGLAYLAWRHQVAVIGGGEQHAEPFANWQFGVLPHTLHSMWIVVINKGGYFGLATFLTGLALWNLLRRRASGLELVFAVSFVGFTVFLIWVYLAVFIGYEGWSAASFWRYHTQLGALQLAAAAALAGRLPPLGRRTARALGAVCLTLALAGPVVAMAFIRFDIHPVKDHVRAAVADMAPLLPAGALLTVVDPAGPYFFSAFIDWYLGFGHQVGAYTTIDTTPERTHALLSSPEVTYAYVVATSAAVDNAVGHALAPTASHFLKHEAAGWRLVRSWPYEGFSSARDYKY
jgi:hypothetical protein